MFFESVSVRYFEAAGGSSGGGASAIRAGSAFVELFVKNNLFYRGLDAAKAKFRAFGSFMAKLGMVSIGFKALIAPLQSAVGLLSDTSKLGDVAMAFGLTAEQASRLFGIMKASGSDIRDAVEGIATFGQRVQEALAGTGEESKKLFDGLGVGAEQFANLNPADQFYKVVDAIKRVQDPMTRVQLLMKAFGEDTGKNLVGVLGMTRSEMEQLGDVFQMSAAEIEEARQANKQYIVATAQLQRVWQSLASNLAPIIKEFAGQIADVAKVAIDFIKEYRPIIGLVFKGAVAFAAGSAALYGLIAVATPVITAIGGIASVFGGIASVVGTVAGLLVTGLGGAFALLTSVAGIAVGALAAIPEILAIVGIASGVLVALGAAVVVVGGFIAAILTLTELFPEFGNFLSEVGDYIYSSFAPAFELAWEAAKRFASVISTVMSPIIKAFGRLLDHVVPTLQAIGGYIMTAFGPAITAVIDTFAATFRELGKVFGETWGGLVEMLKRGEFQAAMQIAWAGAKAAWGIAVAGLQAAWQTFVISFKQGSKEAASKAGHDFIDFAVAVADEFIDIGTSLKIFFAGVLKSIQETMLGGIKAAADMALAVAGLFPKLSPQRLLLEAGANKAKEIADRKIGDSQSDFNQRINDAYNSAAGKKDTNAIVGKELAGRLDQLLGVNLEAKRAAEMDLKAIEDWRQVYVEGLQEELSKAMADVRNSVQNRPEVGPMPRELELQLNGLVTSAKVGVAAAGTFGGRAIGQSLGLGGSVQGQIANNTKKAAEEAEKINEQMKKFNENREKFD